MNITFGLHRYPPINVEEGKPWTGVGWLFKAMDYLKAKGFDVWLGEFSGLTWGSKTRGTANYAESKEFTVQCINACVKRNIPFNAWEFLNDHYLAEGFWKDCLDSSNYKTAQVLPSGGSRFLYWSLLIVFILLSMVLLTSLEEKTND